MLGMFGIESVAPIVSITNAMRRYAFFPPVKATCEHIVGLGGMAGMSFKKSFPDEAQQKAACPLMETDCFFRFKA